MKVMERMHLAIFPNVLCADKLFKVDNDRHVTEDISLADEGYQMKDAGCTYFCVIRLINDNRLATRLFLLKTELRYSNPVELAQRNSAISSRNLVVDDEAMVWVISVLRSVL